MASRKSGNTNKTAHVLNVIAGASTPRPEAERPQTPAAPQEPAAPPINAIEAAPAVEVTEPVVSAPEAPAEAPQAPVAQHPVPPILQVARAADESLSLQIRDALEQELEAETLAASEKQPAPEPPSSDLSAAPSLDAPAEETPPAGSAVIPTGDGASSPQEPAPSTEEEAPASPAEPESPPAASSAPAAAMPPAVSEPPETTQELLYVNVMQQLVEEQAMRYIRMFGVCDCPRCVIDVKALALTNLPPKYVVMRRGEMVPMLTVYEKRFSTAVTAQLIQACKKVMEFPRHDL